MLIVEAEMKWFSKSRDYGFLVPMRGASQFGDILIHGDVVRKTAGMTIEPGTRVKCSVTSSTGKGLRAVAVHEVVKPVRFARFLRARVKSYGEDFGFLTAAGQSDIFIHASVLKRAGMPRLEQNEEVLVRIASKRNGKLRAVAIRPLPPISMR